jgi:hypothetical protein
VPRRPDLDRFVDQSDFEQSPLFHQTRHCMDGPVLPGRRPGPGGDLTERLRRLFSVATRFGGG